MTDYKVAQKVIHWLMALIIGLDLFIASKFGHAMEIADRLESRVDHSSLGMIVATLLVIRILLRVIYGAAPLPSGMAGWQIISAKLGHGLMYLTMIGLIGTGMLTALNATDPILLFQSIPFSIGNLDEDQFQFVRQFHDFCTELMIVLIAVHIAAALFHSFVLKDDSSQRMLKFWKSVQRPTDSV